MGFFSDKISVYTYLDRLKLFGLSSENMYKRNTRRLKSENLDYSQRYFDKLLELLGNHNILERVHKLWSEVNEGDISDKQIRDYQMIEITINECMWTAERRLPKPD